MHTPASGNGAAGNPTPRHFVATGAAVTMTLRADADVSRAAVATSCGGKDEDGGNGDRGGGDSSGGGKNKVASSAHAVSGSYREGGSTRSHSIATSGSSAESDGGAHYRDDGNVSGNTSTHGAATGMVASYPGGGEPLPIPPLAYQQAMMFQQQEQFQQYMQYQLQQHQQQSHQELGPADYHHMQGLYALQQQHQQQQVEFQQRQFQQFIASGGAHSLQFLPPQPPYNAQYPAVFGSPSPGPPLPAGQVPIPIPVPMVMQLRVGGGGGLPSAHMRGGAASGSGGSSGGVRYTDDGRSSAGADSREGLITPSAMASNAYGRSDSSPIVYNVNNYRYSRGGEAAGGGRGVNMIPPSSSSSSSSSSVNYNAPSAAPRYRNSAIGVAVGASAVGSVIVNGSSYSRPSTSHQKQGYAFDHAQQREHQ